MDNKKSDATDSVFPSSEQPMAPNPMQVYLACQGLPASFLAFQGLMLAVSPLGMGAVFFSSLRAGTQLMLQALEPFVPEESKRKSSPSSLKL